MHMQVSERNIHMPTPAHRYSIVKKRMHLFDQYRDRNCVLVIASYYYININVGMILTKACANQTLIRGEGNFDWKPGQILAV